MLQFTRRVDYALIALTHLALAPDGQTRVSARELARAYDLSQPLVANVLKALAKGGLVESVRGTKGGYELLVPADRLTVGRVSELLEGPLRLAECVGDADPRAAVQHKDGKCCLSRTCPVRQSVFRIHLKIRDVLYGVTIAELARTARRPGEALPVTYVDAPSAGEAP